MYKKCGFPPLLTFQILSVVQALETSANFSKRATIDCGLSNTALAMVIRALCDCGGGRGHKNSQLSSGGQKVEAGARTSRASMAIMYMDPGSNLLSTAAACPGSGRLEPLARLGKRAREAGGAMVGATPGVAVLKMRAIEWN